MFESYQTVFVGDVKFEDVLVDERQPITTTVWNKLVRVDGYVDHLPYDIITQLRAALNFDAGVLSMGEPVHQTPNDVFMNLAIQHMRWDMMNPVALDALFDEQARYYDEQDAHAEYLADFDDQE